MIRMLEGTEDTLFPFFLGLLIWTNPLQIAGQDQRFDQQSVVDTRVSERLQSEIDSEDFNPVVLEFSILEATNQTRIEKGLKPLTRDSRLGRSARRYSEDMVRRRRLSHETPTSGLKTLADRLKKFGVTFINAVVAENLAVDYCLNISNIPYYLETRSGKKQYIDARTRQPIRPHTYLTFARQTVAHWMESPGHRENLLNPEFESIGIGASLGKYQGLDAVYVTQHFWGRLVENRKP